MDNNISPEEIKLVTDVVSALKTNYTNNIVGQVDLFNKLLLALFSGGHILLEGAPGLAKTRSINIIAKTINASFKRIQFTPDLLPSDIVGNLVYNPKDGNYITKTGPIFANLVLADEINRAPAKVQSALLEAMQEKQVTLGDETFTLPRPFLVLATQNPIEQEGTYPLPEAQVDRFLMKTIISYPTLEEESQVLDMIEKEKELTLPSKVELDKISAIQDISSKVYVDKKLKDYIAKIVYCTRFPEKFNLPGLRNVISFGASPRGSIAFLKLAKINALINNRNYVVPEDIKFLRYDILRHRIVITYEAEAEGVSKEHVIDEIFNNIQVP